MARAPAEHTRTAKPETEMLRLRSAFLDERIAPPRLRNIERRHIEHRDETHFVRRRLIWRRAITASDGLIFGHARTPCGAGFRAKGGRVAWGMVGGDKTKQRIVDICSIPIAATTTHCKTISW
jgi:hypothetical protein